MGNAHFGFYRMPGTHSELPLRKDCEEKCFPTTRIVGQSANTECEDLLRRMNRFSSSASSSTYSSPGMTSPCCNSTVGNSYQQPVSSQPYVGTTSFTQISGNNNTFYQYTGGTKSSCLPPLAHSYDSYRSRYLHNPVSEFTSQLGRPYSRIFQSSRNYWTQQQNDIHGSNKNQFVSSVSNCQPSNYQTIPTFAATNPFKIDVDRPTESRYTDCISVLLPSSSQNTSHQPIETKIQTEPCAVKNNNTEIPLDSFVAPIIDARNLNATAQPPKIGPTFTYSSQQTSNRLYLSPNLGNDRQDDLNLSSPNTNKPTLNGIPLISQIQQAPDEPENPSLQTGTADVPPVGKFSLPDKQIANERPSNLSDHTQRTPEVEPSYSFTGGTPKVQPLMAVPEQIPREIPPNSSTKNSPVKLVSDSETSQTSNDLPLISNIKPVEPNPIFHSPAQIVQNNLPLYSPFQQQPDKYHLNSSTTTPIPHPIPLKVNDTSSPVVASYSYNERAPNGQSLNVSAKPASEGPVLNSSSKKSPDISPLDSHSTQFPDANPMIHTSKLTTEIQPSHLFHEQRPSGQTMIAVPKPIADGPTNNLNKKYPEKLSLNLERQQMLDKHDLKAPNTFKNILIPSMRLPSEKPPIEQPLTAANKPSLNGYHLNSSSKEYQSSNVFPVYSEFTQTANPYLNVPNDRFKDDILLIPNTKTSQSNFPIIYPTQQDLNQPTLETIVPILSLPNSLNTSVKPIPDAQPTKSDGHTSAVLPFSVDAVAIQDESLRNSLSCKSPNPVKAPIIFSNQQTSDSTQTQFEDSIPLNLITTLSREGQPLNSNITQSDECKIPFESRPDSPSEKCSFVLPLHSPVDASVADLYLNLPISSMKIPDNIPFKSSTEHPSHYLLLNSAGQKTNNDLDLNSSPNTLAVNSAGKKMSSSKKISFSSSSAKPITAGHPFNPSKNSSTSLPSNQLLQPQPLHKTQDSFPSSNLPLKQPSFSSTLDSPVKQTFTKRPSNEQPFSLSTVTSPNRRVSRLSKKSDLDTQNSDSSTKPSPNKQASRSSTKSSPDKRRLRFKSSEKSSLNDLASGSIKNPLVDKPRSKSLTKPSPDRNVSVSTTQPNSSVRNTSISDKPGVNSSANQTSSFHRTNSISKKTSSAGEVSSFNPSLKPAKLGVLNSNPKKVTSGQQVVPPNTRPPQYHPPHQTPLPDKNNPPGTTPKTGVKGKSGVCLIPKKQQQEDNTPQLSNNNKPLKSERKTTLRATSDENLFQIPYHEIIYIPLNHRNDHNEDVDKQKEQATIQEQQAAATENPREGALELAFYDLSNVGEVESSTVWLTSTTEATRDDTEVDEHDAKIEPEVIQPNKKEARKSIPDSRDESTTAKINELQRPQKQNNHPLRPQTQKERIEYSVKKTAGSRRRKSKSSNDHHHLYESDLPAEISKLLKEPQKPAVKRILSKFDSYLKRYESVISEARQKYLDGLSDKKTNSTLPLSSMSLSDSSSSKYSSCEQVSCACAVQNVKCDNLRSVSNTKVETVAPAQLSITAPPCSKHDLGSVCPEVCHYSVYSLEQEYTDLQGICEAFGNTIESKMSCTKNIDVDRIEQLSLVSSKSTKIVEKYLFATPQQELVGDGHSAIDTEDDPLGINTLGLEMIEQSYKLFLMSRDMLYEEENNEIESTYSNGDYTDTSSSIASDDEDEFQEELNENYDSDSLSVVSDSLSVDTNTEISEEANYLESSAENEDDSRYITDDSETLESEHETVDLHPDIINCDEISKIPNLLTLNTNDTERGEEILNNFELNCITDNIKAKKCRLTSALRKVIDKVTSKRTLSVHFDLPEIQPNSLIPILPDDDDEDYENEFMTKYYAKELESLKSENYIDGYKILSPPLGSCRNNIEPEHVSQNRDRFKYYRTVYKEEPQIQNVLKLCQHKSLASLSDYCHHEHDAIVVIRTACSDTRLFPSENNHWTPPLNLSPKISLDSDFPIVSSA